MFHAMFAFTAPSPLARAPSSSRHAVCAAPPARAPLRMMTIASPRARSTRANSAPLSGSPPSSASSPPAPSVLEPVQLIDGVEQYLHAIESSQHTLMVLKVFAPWCRSCRALAPKVKRLAREFDSVRFYEMDFERNKELCHRLGVRSMPTFIFYYGAAGEVHKFSCGPQRAGVLREKLQECLDGFCSLEQH